jgi:hypothetical protein
VLSTVRSQRLTTTVCLPRTYCSPCESNVDCAPLPSGAAQFCVADATGGAKYCTSACTRAANCALDAQCVSNDEVGSPVCAPTAGTCKGDGSFCSPCRSDDDCTDGLCLSAPFSPEKFCSVTSKIACVVENDALKADCPKAPEGAPYKVSCSTSNADPEFPQSQCLGIVKFGDQSNIGCWTKAR